MDSNLLVLLVVGRVGRDLVPKHRRLQGYTAEDYDALLELIEPVDGMFVTPNTLSETSNLLNQHGEPERSRFFHMLRLLIENAEEIVVPSKIASSNSDFVRLGLTDVTLIEAATEETPLLTADFNLYVAAMRKSRNAPTAVNFSHIRNL